MTAQCANCKSPHGARADVCAAKKEARQLAWGWRFPPRPRREKGAKAPEAPEHETPATQQEAGEEVDTEVEMEVEPTPEGTEDKRILAHLIWKAGSSKRVRTVRVSSR